MKRYRRIGTTALSVAVLTWFGSPSPASASNSATRPLSARQCADGHSVGSKLRARDLRLIKRFIVCVGKQWTEHTTSGGVGGLGLGGFTTLGGTPSVIRALHGFVHDRKRDETPQFIASHLPTLAEPGCFSYAIGDTARPRPSLATINRWIDKAHRRLEKVPVGAFLRTTAIVERGVWFHDGSRRNVRFAVVFQGDIVTPNTDCSLSTSGHHRAGHDKSHRRTGDKGHQQQHRCAQDGPDTVSLAYVDKAVLPLARQVIHAYRHAKPSERHRRKTNEMTMMSYKHVTEIEARIPARWAHGHGSGTYYYVADFKGRIAPENLVALFVEEDRTVSRSRKAPPPIYSFELGRTRRDGPTTAIGMHWLMHAAYSHGSRYVLHFYASKTASGGFDHIHPRLTAPILGANIHQAAGQLRRAEERKPIKRPRDLTAAGNCG